MTTAVIVQARTGSSRFPSKILKEIGGLPALAHVLTRCAEIKGASVVVCAVPDSRESEPLESIARACGAQVCRGPEEDVLGRYLIAAQAMNAKVVMRVTSDCPVIDPEICDAVLALRAHEDADYAANNMPRSFPHGLDCEAFTVAALAEASGRAHNRHDREHVTPWLRRAPHLKRTNLFSGDASLARHRWTLDYPEDLAFFCALLAAFPLNSRCRMHDFLMALAGRPEISDINAKHRSPVGA